MGIANDLDGDSFALAIVESKTTAKGLDRHDASTHAYLHIGERLASLEICVLVQEFIDTNVDLEFVWIGIRILAGP